MLSTPLVLEGGHLIKVVFRLVSFLVLVTFGRGI